MSEQEAGELVLSDLVQAPGVVEAQTRGEIDVQIATAKRFPRVMSKVLQRVEELATVDEETAAACHYAIPRDGKTIEGPSVRMAEIVATSWGNLRAATRIVDIGDRMVTAQGACMDLENNVAVTAEVKRRIMDKHGRRYSDDMIVTTSQAAASIALRNAVFKVVPMATFRSLEAKIREVAKGDAKTFAARRNAALLFFAQRKVTPERVLKVLGIAGAEDMTADHLLTLRGIITAIKEGSTTVAEAFPEEGGQPGSHTDALKSALGIQPQEAPQTAPEPQGATNGIAPAESSETPKRRGPGRPRKAPANDSLPPAPPVASPAEPVPASTGFDREEAIKNCNGFIARLGADAVKRVAEGLAIDLAAWQTISDGKLDAFETRLQDMVVAGKSKGGA